jgi:hypothetical protein
MTYDEYEKARLNPNRTRMDSLNMARFLDLQPTRCPKCGCQVFDPYGWNIAMHDVTHKSQTVAAMPNVES